MKTPTVQIMQGNCLEELAKIPDGSCQMCVTSPPYWQLRSYLPDNHPLKPHEIGLEKTPEEYVAKMVVVFREVRRTLREDGVLFLNLGDGYAGSGAVAGGEWAQSNTGSGGKWRGGTESTERRHHPPANLKPKDLVGIPWAVAFALRGDGWYLRSAIPWIKRNSMPESVTDRPSSAVEMVFLLSKSESYFFDSNAIRVRYKEESLSRYESPMMGTAPTGRQPNGDADRRIRDKGQREPNPNGRQRRNSDWWFESWQGLYSEGEELLGFVVNPSSFKDAHFATYPPELIKPCILAGTSANGCCPKCGAAWGRVVEVSGRKGKSWHDHSNDDVTGQSKSESAPDITRKTIGWQPTCECGESETVPCTVLDPFFGSGTTGEVCLELGRNCIGIDLNPEYIKLAEQRVNVTPGLPLA